MVDPCGTARTRDRMATLTPREHDVALAVGRGHANAEIAAALHLSVPTVKAHVSRLLDKLDVDNRVQIALRRKEPKCVHRAVRRAAPERVRPVVRAFLRP